MRKATAVLLLFFVLVAQFAFGAAVPVASSKHNLSAASANTIRAAAGGTTEICVFCHTPHGATAGVTQLWNKAVTATGTYTLYGSTFLTGLSYPAAALKDNSRLCLSCHDGTIALGAVNNTPGSGTTGSIAMIGGAMPAARNLTTDLSDDHPVGFQYQPGAGVGQDPELVVRGFPWPKGVQIVPNAAAGTVECKSCHDPHDNQFTKFVRMQITDASPMPTTPASPYLCKYCHNKTNYDLSGHAISTQTYVLATGATANTVQKNGCMACHKTHTATGKQQILRYTEEATCYNAGCHGGNNPIPGNVTANSGTNRLDIQTEMNKTQHRHPTNTVTGLHKDKPFVAGAGAETPADFGNTLATRHAECPDCHNPHQAQRSATVERSTRGTLRISLALKGVWGVEPTWPVPSKAMANNAVTFAPLVTFTKVSGAAVTDEYQVCMKCHSNYVTLPAGVRNIGQEINPGNSSYHGIVPCNVAAYAPAAGNLFNATCTTNFYVNQTTAVAPWSGGVTLTAAAAATCRANPGANANCITLATARPRVWCSDCHGSETTTMPPTAGTKAAPYGPHGSTLNNNGPGTANSDKMLIRTIASDGTNGTPLCLACHRVGSYWSGNTGSRSNYHAQGGSGWGGGRFPQGCFSCHMWDPTNIAGGSGDLFPHGMNKRWAANVGSGASGQMVDSFNGGWYTNINYSTKQCWAATGVTGTACAGWGWGQPGTY